MTLVYSIRIDGEDPSIEKKKEEEREGIGCHVGSMGKLNMKGSDPTKLIDAENKHIRRGLDSRVGILSGLTNNL